MKTNKQPDRVSMSGETLDRAEAAAQVLAEGERLLSFLRNNSGTVSGAAADERNVAFAALARKVAAAAGGLPELKVPVLELISTSKQRVLNGVSLLLVAAALEKLRVACNAVRGEKKAPEDEILLTTSASKVKTWDVVAKDPAMSPRKGSAGGSVSPRPSAHDSSPGVSPRPLGAASTSPRMQKQSVPAISAPPPEKLAPSRGHARISQAALESGRVQVVARDAPASGLDLQDVEKLFGEDVSFESMMAKSPRKKSE
jgi:hypothetical protein